MARIVQFGVPFSPNLGDGVISDCLGYGLQTCAPNTELIRVDLSGRQGFGDVMVGNRARIIQVLAMLPGPLRQAVVSARLGQILDRIEPQWRKAIAGADMAIIGGGQLFSDADLNFCLKVARAAELLAEARLPVVVHAAGVADNWSTKGTALFGKVLTTDLRMVGLRDGPSIAAWREQMAAQPGATTAPVPELARDPGLLAALCYGAAPHRGGVGIGVTAAEILSYHADAPMRADLGQDFFAALAIALADRGHEVAFFCNGAAEDRAVLDQLAARDDLRQRGIAICPPPTTPAELARLVGGFDAVVAHRLHACIIAYAYQVPVVGLGWDGKVESFFASVDRQAHFLAAGDITVQGVVDRVESGLADGIDSTRHAEVIQETRDGISRALAAGLGLGAEPVPLEAPTG